MEECRALPEGGNFPPPSPRQGGPLPTWRRKSVRRKQPPAPMPAESPTAPQAIGRASRRGMVRTAREGASFRAALRPPDGGQKVERARRVCESSKRGRPHHAPSTPATNIPTPHTTVPAISAFSTAGVRRNVRAASTTLGPRGRYTGNKAVNQLVVRVHQRCRQSPLHTINARGVSSTASHP